MNEKRYEILKAAATIFNSIELDTPCDVAQDNAVSIAISMLEEIEKRLNEDE